MLLLPSLPRLSAALLLRQGLAALEVVRAVRVRANVRARIGVDPVKEHDLGGGVPRRG